MLGDSPTVDVSCQVLNPETCRDRIGELLRTTRVDTGSPPALGELQVVVGDDHPSLGQVGYFVTRKIGELLREVVGIALRGCAAVLVTAATRSR
jgi:hypothetical protein